MPVNFNLFPRYRAVDGWQQSTIKAFEVPSIDTSSGNMSSNAVLNSVAPGLEQAGYQVEKSKSEIKIPVLYGLNGAIEKYFEADAYHPEEKAVLEVEAGRAVPNNAVLKDLFEACVMQEVDHLVIAACNQYQPKSFPNPDPHFHKVSIWMETLFSSSRLRLPLRSVLIIGY